MSEGDVHGFINNVVLLKKNEERTMAGLEFFRKYQKNFAISVILGCVWYHGHFLMMEQNVFSLVEVQRMYRLFTRRIWRGIRLLERDFVLLLNPWH